MHFITGSPSHITFYSVCKIKHKIIFPHCHFLVVLVVLSLVRFSEKLKIFLLLQILCPVDVAIFLLFFLFRFQQFSLYFSLSFKRTFPHIALPLPFSCLFHVDEQPRESQSGLTDSPLLAQGSTKERPQAHPERRHSQRRVRGPCQQVHPAPPGSCGWGQSQQVQVSTALSLLRNQRTYRPLMVRRKDNRKFIHVTGDMKENDQPFWNIMDSAHRGLVHKI